ncbi:MAG: hypothetical protein KDJ31_19945 [Candidatus Competibacteraceae bacterium]|nr:hypothetical protein [Candidatus Competibacteraceae bacterium]
MSVIALARYAIKSAIDTGKVGEELVDEAVFLLCSEFGGDRVYWPKYDRAARNKSIFMDRAAGYSLDMIADRNGVSRPTVVSVLKGIEEI